MLVKDAAEVNIPQRRLYLNNGETMKFEITEGLPSGIKLYEYDELSSTNDKAKEVELGEKGAFVIAKSQTGGRGRMGRSFSSEKGGFYVSYAFEPKGDISDLFLLMPLTAVVVSRLVEKICGAKCGIKWPNDVLISGKKVCGILTEAVYTNEKYRVIVGVGINVNNTLPKELGDAVSICEITEEPLDLAEAYGEFIKLMTELVSGYPENFEILLEEYREKCVTLGKNVTVTYGGERINAVAAEVGKTGGLIVDTIDGKRIEITSGEATLRV